MSIRSIVYQSLANDDTLADMGIDSSRVFPAHSLDAGETPPDSGKFIVLRFEEIARPQNGRGPRIVTVWVHHSRNDSVDYLEIDEALMRCSVIMTELDPSLITDVRWMGTGSDLVDDGFNTITRNSVFEMLGKENWNGNF